MPRVLPARRPADYCWTTTDAFVFAAALPSVPPNAVAHAVAPFLPGADLAIVLRSPPPNTTAAEPRLVADMIRAEVPTIASGEAIGTVVKTLIDDGAAAWPLIRELKVPRLVVRSSVTGTVDAWNNGLGNFANGFLTDVTVEAPLVTSLGESMFRMAKNIKRVDLSRCTAMTSIGKEALYSCEALTEVLLPASLTELGKGALTSCTSLTALDLSSCVGLQSIGVLALAYCSSLRTVTFGALPRLRTLGECAVSDTPIKEVDLSQCPALKDLGTHCFSNCVELKAVDLSSSDSLESLQGQPFGGCKKLACVYLPLSARARRDTYFDTNAGAPQSVLRPPRQPGAPVMTAPTRKSDKKKCIIT